MDNRIAPGGGPGLVLEARRLSERGAWLASRCAGTACWRAFWPDTATSRSLRAKALCRLGDQADWQNDQAAAQPAYEESLALFRNSGYVGHC